MGYSLRGGKEPEQDCANEHSALVGVDMCQSSSLAYLKCAQLIVCQFYSS